MEIFHATLDTCDGVSGTVVVIDVIRAFTTAAFAFAAGARDILPVSGVEEALALRERFPGSLVMGEVGGLPPPGFDFGNSPAALVGVDLTGRRLIQRTGAGTQGIVRSVGAETLLASSFVVAEATVRKILEEMPSCVTLVSTTSHGEDQACADYLAARLLGETPDPGPYLQRVYDAALPRIERGFSILPEAAADPAGFLADLECCTSLDRFPFAMQVQRRDDLLVLENVI